MKILQLIMSHRNALPTIERHLPIWRGITNEIIFASPKDSCMSDNRFFLGYPEIRIGEAEHNGEKSAQRIIKTFEFALGYPEEWDHLLLMEYDAIALDITTDVIPMPGGVSAAKYKQNKPIKFKGKFYLHYPMLFTREAFEKVYQELPKIGGNDRHFSDRFIGRAVELAKVPVKDLIKNKRAFSKNTIGQQHYPKLREAVKEGAVFFHGVKNLETLSHIIEIPKIEPITLTNY